MANVDVAGEVAAYGMVVDPGCMKHMDCISVCPNDALYFGFGKPATSVRKTEKRNYSLTWPEEILAAVVFAASFFAVWDVYLLVPMLMALGIAAVTTFLVVRSFQMLRTREISFYRWALKADGKLGLAGVVFLAFAAIWTLLSAHSGYIRYHELLGRTAFGSLTVPDELALAQDDPSVWLSGADRQNAAAARSHLYKAFDGGFIVNTANLQSLGWVEFLMGNAEQGEKLLALAAARQEGSARALTDYYRGAIFNRTGRASEALGAVDRAVAERPDLVKANEERGVALWKLERRDDAIAAWKTAASQGSILANYMLAGSMADDAGIQFRQAAESGTPEDPYFNWMVGLRLRELGMNELAERRFQRAVQMDSTFILRRKK